MLIKHYKFSESLLGPNICQVLAIFDTKVLNYALRSVVLVFVSDVKDLLYEEKLPTESGC